MEDYKKKYEEALSWARSAINAGANGMLKEDLEHIFPELKESEDERIWTINYLNNRKLNSSIIEEKESLKRAIAWLEKQREQKIEPTPIFKIGDILKRKGKDYTFRVDRIQGGYYHCDHNHGALFPIEEQGNWELVEQKSAWCEKEKVRIDRIINVLDWAEEKGRISYSDWEDYVTYVKSLKPQNNQNPAWSEEDEKAINDIMWIIEAYRKNGFNETHIQMADSSEIWLKSLKNKVQLHPKQEWSEKDKCMLNNVIDTLKPLSQTTHSGYAINSMIDWLKYLKERIK